MRELPGRECVVPSPGSARIIRIRTARGKAPNRPRENRTRPQQSAARRGRTRRDRGRGAAHEVLDVAGRPVSAGASTRSTGSSSLAPAALAIDGGVFGLTVLTVTAWRPAAFVSRKAGREVRRKREEAASRPPTTRRLFSYNAHRCQPRNDCGLLAYPRCSPKAPAENNQQPSNCLLFDGLTCERPRSPKESPPAGSEKKPPPKLSLTAVSEPDPITLSTLCQFYLFPRFATTVPAAAHSNHDADKNFSACKNAPPATTTHTTRRLNRLASCSKSNAFNTLPVYH